MKINYHQNDHKSDRSRIILVAAKRVGISSSYDTFMVLIEPRRKKTCHPGFQLGPTQTGLYSHRKRLKA